MAKETQVNEAAFLKRLNRKKAALKAAAKAERPSGIMSDEAIMSRLGLETVADRITVSAKVSKIQTGDAKGDVNRPYFRFAYTLTEDSPLSDKGKGLIVSNYHELTEAESNGEVWRTEEEAFERVFFEFQSLGENTAEWDDPGKMLMECAKKHTQNKTDIQLSFSCYERGKGGMGMNISVVNVLDNSDLEDTEEEEVLEDEVPYSEWVDGWVSWGNEEEGYLDFLVQSYDEDEETFTGVDEDGEEQTAPCNEVEWAEDQRED